MTTAARTISDDVAAGREALERGAWAEARQQFEVAPRSKESGEAWEGLGWAGYWLHDAELTLRARERAYQALSRVRRHLRRRPRGSVAGR